jgi:hypothetical protein
MILYYSPQTRAFAVLWALEELGSQYELKIIDLQQGAQKTAAAMANDFGENHQDEDRSVVSRSMARVNPSIGKSANASSAYGYAAAPITKQRH